jgi:hypothetical protein
MIEDCTNNSPEYVNVNVNVNVKVEEDGKQTLTKGRKEES